MKIEILLDQSDPKWMHELFQKTYMDGKCMEPVTLKGDFLFLPSLSQEIMHITESFGSGRITHCRLISLKENIELKVSNK